MEMVGLKRFVTGPVILMRTLFVKRMLLDEKFSAFLIRSQSSGFLRKDTRLHH